MTIDQKIGAIIKARRVQLGLSFQQVQKYEKNKSELTVSRLAQFANALQLLIMDILSESTAANDANSSNREVLELIKAFNSIESQAISNLARAASNT